MKNAIGIDYTTFESGSLSFDYEKMMRETGYTLEEMQKDPILYRSRKNSSFRAQKYNSFSKKICGARRARIFIKDEAGNPSGSFKARRAANAVYHAKIRI